MSDQMKENMDTPPQQAAPTREKRLVKGTLVYFAGTVGTSLLQILLVRIITGALLPEEYGYFELVYSAMLLLVPALTMQVAEGMFRMMFSADEEKRNRYISSAFFVCALSIAAFWLVMLVCHLLPMLGRHWPEGGPRAFALFVGESVRFPLLFALYFAGFAMYTYYQLVARSLSQSGLFATAGVVNTFILLATQLVLLLVFHMKIEAMFVSGIAAWAGACLLFELRMGVRRRVRPRYVDRETLGELLRYSLPLVPNAVCWWPISHINRFIINGTLGTHTVGIFNAGYRFTNIIYMFTSVLQMSWQESAILESESGAESSFYNETFRSYMRLLMSALLVLLPAVTIGMPILLAPSYQGAAQYVPLLLLATVFEAFTAFMSTGYVVSKKTKEAALTVLMGGALNVCIVFALIRPLGAYAAVLGSIAGFVSMWLVRTKRLYGTLRIRIDARMLSLLCALLAVWFAAYYLLPAWTAPIVLLAGGCAFCALNRQAIRIFLTMFLGNTFGNTFGNKFFGKRKPGNRAAD